MVESSTKRITWSALGSTEYHAYNQKNEHLGFLKRQRVGQFIHWCWWQDYVVWMSPSCVDEMRLKQKELGGKK